MNEDALRADFNDETDAVNVALDALRHADADIEVDVEAEAEEFKRLGNDALKKGDEYRVAAIKLYTKAIKCDVHDQTKRSVYFSNRAAANLIGGEARAREVGEFFFSFFHCLDQKITAKW